MFNLRFCIHIIDMLHFRFVAKHLIAEITETLIDLYIAIKNHMNVWCAVQVLWGNHYFIHTCKFR